MKYYALVFSLLFLPFQASAAAKELPSGCYSGTLENGATSTMMLTRISKDKFAISEYISDLEFGWPNPTNKISYTVKAIKGRNYYRGIQAKDEKISTTFSVSSTVSLRKLSASAIRYHRSLKEQAADDPYGPAQSTKGTLKLTPGACG